MTRVTAPAPCHGAVATAARGAFLLGMLLLGFSTSPADGLVVVAYGLPLLALSGGLYVAFRLRNTKVDDVVVPFFLTGLALACALLLATIVSPQPTESFARFVPNFLGFLLFCYVLSPLYREAVGLDRHEELAVVIVASGSVIGAYFLIRFTLAVIDLGFAAVIVDRVTGGVYSLPWGATNVVGSVLILPIFLSFYASRIVRRALRPLVFLGRVVMFAAAAVALSRAVNICLLAGLLLLFAVLRGKARAHLVGFLLLVAAVVVAIDVATGGAISGQLLSAFVDRFESSDTASLNGRSEIWTTFLGAFAQSPLVGVGYFASLRKFETTGHNFLLTSLVERGVIGLVLSGLVVVAAFWYWWLALRRAPTERLRFFVSVLGVGGFSSLAHLLFEDANFTQPYMIMSWIALSLPFLAWRRAVELEPHLNAHRITSVQIA